jgi:hypothetical protein
VNAADPIAGTPFQQHPTETSREQEEERVERERQEDEESACSALQGPV